MRKIVPVPALRHLVPPNVEQLLDSQILDVPIAEDHVESSAMPSLGQRYVLEHHRGYVIGGQDATQVGPDTPNDVTIARG